MTDTALLTSADLRDLRVRVANAQARSRKVVADAQRLIADSRRAPSERPEWPRFFALHGSIGGRRVRASWCRGHLVASEELRAMGDVLVAMGEQFTTEDHRHHVAADLTRALPAMLTLLRACERVQDVRFGPAGAPLDVHPLTS
ncbi:MAG TPA: hypothetical protein VE991_02085 [Acidimicrobiales bacterium]|nr:hypothetical protein [Acidimicrobiales bacterium]